MLRRDQSLILRALLPGHIEQDGAVSLPITPGRKHELQPEPHEAHVGASASWRPGARKQRAVGLFLCLRLVPELLDS